MGNGTGDDHPYASERGRPTLPTCGARSVRLSFDGEHLWLHGINVIEDGRNCRVVEDPMGYPAVSGRPGSNGGFSYTAERQTQSNVGPIPAGRYWITPSELWEANIVHWIIGATDAWGHFRISIHPYPTTATHHRGGFFIHGGTEAGSAGCIDLTNHMSRFIRHLRTGVKETDCHIPLTVDYSGRR